MPELHVPSEIPSFSLGLSQEDDANIDNVHGEVDGVYDDEDGVRKSKRLNLVLVALRKDFDLGKKMAQQAKDSNVFVYGADSSADYLAKFAAIFPKLHLQSRISLGNGVSVSGQELVEVAERVKILGPMIVDVLVFLVRQNFHKVGMRVQEDIVDFYDTTLVSSMMKHNSKFNRTNKKDLYIFSGDVLPFFQGEDGKTVVLDRIYVPFNFNKKHWVGVCIDIAGSSIHVLDCNVPFRSDNLVKKCLNPVAKMLPYVIKQAARKLVNPKLRPFSVQRLKGIPRNGINSDYAITKILLIQAHAHGGVEACKRVTPKVVPT